MKLFSRQYGEEGPPLIILHGLLGLSDNWTGIAKSLSSVCKVYTLDQRNHGLSPHSEEFSYQALSEDVKEFMDDNSIEKAVLLGHSMGGKTAMNLAVNYPDRVEKLIVVDISPRYYPVHHREIINALFSIDVENIKSRKEAEDKLSERIEDDAVRLFLLKNLAWNDDGKLEWKMNLEGISSSIDNVGEELRTDGRYDGPVLFIRGEESSYIQDKDMQRILGHFPAASLVTVEGAGHWVHAEKPEELLKAVREFLGR
jgi:esterase